MCCHNLINHDSPWEGLTFHSRDIRLISSSITASESAEQSTKCFLSPVVRMSCKDLKRPIIIIQVTTSCDYLVCSEGQFELRLQSCSASEPEHTGPNKRGRERALQSRC